MARRLNIGAARPPKTHKLAGTHEKEARRHRTRGRSCGVAEGYVSFDPSAIHEYHDKVRAKIEAEESGFAQSVVNEVMVSYESASFRGPIYGYDPVAFGTTPRVSAILEEMIIDVARGEGIASPRTFSRARVERLVADLQSFPATYVKPRRRAELLHAFYLAEGAPGNALLF
jgi:hypothetical protein